MCRYMCMCQVCVLDGGLVCEVMHMCEHTVVHICVSVAFADAYLACVYLATRVHAYKSVWSVSVSV